jgi:hypothetical protein
MIEQNRRRDDLGESIDRLFITASTPESRETLNVFRQICDDIKQISDILTKTAETNNMESIKVANIIERLEKRMTDHENAFREKVNEDNINNAKVLGRNSVITWLIGGSSSLALVFSIGAFWKFIAIEKMFDHVTQMQVTLTEHQKRIYDLEIKFVENMRISAVENTLVDVKKKTSHIMSKKAFNAMK